MNPKPHRKPWHTGRHQTVFEGETMTQQSHKDSVNVNKIISRYDRTGILPQNPYSPVYGDVSAFARPFQEALDASGVTIEQAREFANSWEPPKDQEPEITNDPGEQEAQEEKK